ADDSTYFRFSGGAHGWLRIVVSRRDWGGNTRPSPFRVLIGPIRLSDHNQPVLASVRRRANGTVASLQTKVLCLPTTDPAFAAKVVVAQKFIPSDHDPRSSDGRLLGAEVNYRFFTKRPPAKRCR